MYRTAKRGVRGAAQAGLTCDSRETVNGNWFQVPSPGPSVLVTAVTVVVIVAVAASVVVAVMSIMLVMGVGVVAAVVSAAGGHNDRRGDGHSLSPGSGHSRCDSPSPPLPPAHIQAIGVRRPWV